MLNLKRRCDRGTSLFEILLVAILIGIVASLGVPNLLGLYRRYQVSKAMAEMEGAIKEAQRQAMRLGRVCRVNINPINNLITGNPSNCLLSQRKIDNSIDIRTNLSGATPNISFSSKGSTTKMGTIVVSAAGTSEQECFVISLGLGISRTGDYTGNKSGSVSSTKCKTN